MLQRSYIYESMFTRTKIVCTIGPSVNSFENICALIDAGMDVARLNCSHGTHEEHAKSIALLKKAREEKNKPLALMLDLRGPKICVGDIQNGALSLKTGQRICLVEKGDGSPEAIELNPFEVIQALKPGMKILFDDGSIISEVVEVLERRIVVEIQNPGVLKRNKGVNIPSAILPLPAITEEDFRDLEFGCKQDVDFIAASFMRSAEHVLAVKEQTGSIPVIAKIEDMQGVENFESIMAASDGIMVARGDLGVEVDLATIPRLQKMMIRKCIAASKTVITATQMLESMVKHPRPTRAEVSDVANAIYDSSSAIMLSAETAIGNYPIEAVQLMKKIALDVEAELPEGKAVFVKGEDVNTLSARPSTPVIAVTQNKKLYHQLALSWGVTPMLCSSLDEARKMGKKT